MHIAWVDPDVSAGGGRLVRSLKARSPVCPQLEATQYGELRFSTKSAAKASIDR